MQSVLIIAKVVNSNPAHGEVYLIQLYVIKFVGDFPQVGNPNPVFNGHPSDKRKMTIYDNKQLI
jgi:hypothetical protein